MSVSSHSRCYSLGGVHSKFLRIVVWEYLAAVMHAGAGITAALYHKLHLSQRGWGDQTIILGVLVNQRDRLWHSFLDKLKIGAGITKPPLNFLAFI